MKTKKLEKMFVLNKETIANLNRDDMAAVRGGLATCEYTCMCIPNKETMFPTKESQGGTCDPSVGTGE
jgi:hypothetical protein